MQTKRRPKSQPNADQGSTRGIRVLPVRAGRPSPFGLEWSERAWDADKACDYRKVCTQFFPTAEARDRRAVELSRDRRDGALRTLSRPDVDAWIAFKAVIGETPWQQVVAAWQQAQKGTTIRTGGKNLGDHVKDYLKAQQLRVDDGGLSLNTWRQRRHKLELLSADLGSLALFEVRSDRISGWLKAQKLTNAGTYNNFLKIVRGFFSDAVTADLLAVNPCDKLSTRDERTEEVGILTVPQIAQLFHIAATFTDGSGAALYAVALRRLALEAFAGVRFSSACRLRAEDINVADRGIRHPAASIKTRRRQYVEGFPAPLWAWLAIAPDDTELTERQYLTLKSGLFGAARVPHPHNCLRHSFATYHLAARANPGETAVLLCHRNQQKLWDSYKGNATGAEGRRWEALTPQTASLVAAEWQRELEQRARPASPQPAQTTP